MKKFILTTLLLVLLVGCTTSNNNQQDNSKLEVVASTTMLGDLVNQIGQENVNVTMLFGPGIDPHLALPTGGDTKVIQDSDLVVFSGLDLEAQFSQILNAYEEKTTVVGDLLDEESLLTVEEEGGLTIDPHYWFSVEIWKEATIIVRDALIESDPDNSEDYTKSTEEYLEELEALDQWIIDRVNELPSESRILLTAHDAFNYFGDAYGFEVAAIAGMSTESEVTIDDVNQIATMIVDNNVPTIFIESTVPQTTVDSVIAEVNRRGSDVAIGDELYSDALGVGEDAEYINAFKHNVNSIVDGLK